MTATRLAAITAELDALVVSPETEGQLHDLIAEANDLRTNSGIGEYEELESYLGSAESSASPYAKIVNSYLRGLLAAHTRGRSE